MNAVTVQIQVDKESGHSGIPVFTETALLEIAAAVRACVTTLEKHGYTRRQMFLNDVNKDELL